MLPIEAPPIQEPIKLTESTEVSGWVFDDETPPPPWIIPAVVGTGDRISPVAISIPFPEQTIPWYESAHVQVVELGLVPDSVFKLHTDGNPSVHPDKYIAIHTPNSLDRNYCVEGLFGLPPGWYDSCIASMKGKNTILVSSSDGRVHKVPVYNLGNMMVFVVDELGGVHPLDEEYVYPSNLQLQDLLRVVGGGVFSPTVDTYRVSITDTMLQDFAWIDPETLRPTPTPKPITVGDTLPVFPDVPEYSPSATFLPPPGIEAITPFIGEAEPPVSTLRYEFSPGSLPGVSAFESRSDNPKAVDLVSLLSQFPSQDDVMRLFNSNYAWNWLDTKWWNADQSVFCPIDLSSGLTAEKVLFVSLYPETNSFVIVAENNGMILYMTGSMKTLQDGVRSGSISYQASDTSGNPLDAATENFRRDILGAKTGLVGQRDERKIRLVGARLVRKMQTDLPREVDIARVPLSSLLPETISGRISVKQIDGSMGYEPVTFPSGAYATVDVHNTLVFDPDTKTYVKTLSIDSGDSNFPIWSATYNAMHPLLDSTDGLVKGTGFPALTISPGKAIHIVVPMNGYIETPIEDSPQKPTPTPVSFTDPFFHARKIDVLAINTYNRWLRPLSFLTQAYIPKPSVLENENVVYISPEARRAKWRAHPRQTNSWVVNPRTELKAMVQKLLTKNA